MLAENELGKNAFETLGRIAKYYAMLGYKKADIRRELEQFILRCKPFASVVCWSDTIESAVKYGMKHPLVMVEKVIITKPEMERIQKINGVQAQRLAFTLLCIAKFTMLVDPKTDGWVNTERDIMRMANINTSYKRQNLLYGQLLDAGMLQPSKRITNLNVRVLYMEEGETALEVTDYRNLGNQYMKYLGGPYFVCRNCGQTVRIPAGANPWSVKYCPECAAQVKMKQSVDSVMRKRRGRTRSEAEAASI